MEIALCILTLCCVALYAVAAKRGKKIEILDAGCESWQAISTAQTKEILRLDREIKKQDEIITAHRRVIDAREQQIEILEIELKHANAKRQPLQQEQTGFPFDDARNDSKKKALPILKRSARAKRKSK